MIDGSMLLMDTCRNRQGSRRMYVNTVYGCSYSSVFTNDVCNHTAPDLPVLPLCVTCSIDSCYFTGFRGSDAGGRQRAKEHPFCALAPNAMQTGKNFCAFKDIGGKHIDRHPCGPSADKDRWQKRLEGRPSQVASKGPK